MTVFVTVSRDPQNLVGPVKIDNVGRVGFDGKDLVIYQHNNYQVIQFVLAGSRTTDPNENVCYGFSVV